MNTKIDKSNDLYLNHILEAIDIIQGYIRNRSFEEFKANPMVLDAVIRQITIIGEAANNISQDFKDDHPDLPWHQAIGMRNQIVHGYYLIKPEIVWQTYKEDLPALKKQVQKLLS